MRSTRSTRSTRAAVLAVALLAITGTAISGTAIAGAPAWAADTPRAATVAHDDFNGDGFPDVVMAAPAGSVGGKTGAGFVSVLYGSSKGVDTAKRVVLSQSSAGVPGSPEAHDAFGAAVTSADLDGDGYADLAVGAPGEDIDGAVDAGSVTVLWGSARGLTGTSSWLENNTLGAPVAREAYGTGLAAADVDGDGRPELAHVTAVDAVYVHDFSESRTPGSPEQSHGVPTENGFRPNGLTGADYDKDGYADLVVTGTAPNLELVEGHAVLLRGSADGLAVDGSAGGGWTGVSGDINKDGYPDLVLGAPRTLEHGEWDLSAGAVLVHYGSPDGPFAKPAQVFLQGQGGIPGSSEVGDDFGADLSLGDVNGDGYLDLAIGSPGESIGELQDAGAVWLLRGSAQGLRSAGVQNFNQNTADVPGASEEMDRFGAQVRLVDADRDGHAELVTTAPYENDAAGFAWVLDANKSGLTAAGSWSFGATALGVQQDNHYFGSVVGK
ncbi:VCBS repeat-containing protein [Streptomyces lincolnensis]|uniref:FG-GAP-like repeat-containing protein n=1 Tax=Streptomyces lincolnensis TaxID=1915 RepID=UPI001E2C78D1|nr:FG-GAP-like repeat-containing protein [Streptomyces lincolnensis]MCD7444654.1 VCBS repeat-containing protein [Streptomyces lincolnensis]